MLAMSMRDVYSQGDQVSPSSTLRGSLLGDVVIFLQTKRLSLVFLRREKVSSVRTRYLSALFPAVWLAWHRVSTQKEYLLNEKNKGVATDNSSSFNITQNTEGEQTQGLGG